MYWRFYIYIYITPSVHLHTLRSCVFRLHIYIYVCVCNLNTQLLSVKANRCENQLVISGWIAQDRTTHFFMGWCEHAPLVSNIKAAPGCGRLAIRFVHPIWVRELFLYVWYKIDDMILNNIINFMLLCWSLLYLLDFLDLEYCTNTSNIICFEKASSFKQENHLTATTTAAATTTITMWASALCICFYINPALLNGSTQFLYCTISNPGTGADDAFVLKRGVWRNATWPLHSRPAIAASARHFQICFLP